MRTKCAISDAFVRDCVFAYCASVAQHVYSLSAEHCFRLRNSAISDERVRDCALSTHSVFRPLAGLPFGLRLGPVSPPGAGPSSSPAAGLCASRGRVPRTPLPPRSARDAHALSPRGMRSAESSPERQRGRPCLPPPVEPRWTT